MQATAATAAAFAAKELNDAREKGAAAERAAAAAAAAAADRERELVHQKQAMEVDLRAEHEQALAAMRSRVLSAEDEAERARTKLADFGKDLAAAERVRDDLQRSRDDLANQKAELEASLARALACQEDAGAGAAKLQADLEAVQAALNAKQAEVEQLSRQLATDQSELERER